MTPQEWEDEAQHYYDLEDKANEENNPTLADYYHQKGNACLAARDYALESKDN